MTLVQHPSSPQSTINPHLHLASPHPTPLLQCETMLRSTIRLRHAHYTPTTRLRPQTCHPPAGPRQPSQPTTPHCTTPSATHLYHLPDRGHARLTRRLDPLLQCNPSPDVLACVIRRSSLSTAVASVLVSRHRARQWLKLHSRETARPGSTPVALCARRLETTAFARGQVG
jgi:hypothetical protein